MVGKFTLPGLSGSKVTFPQTTGQDPTSAVVETDGSIWFTVADDSALGRYDPTTHFTTFYPLTLKSSMGTALTVGPNGDLFFAEAKVKKLLVWSSGTTARLLSMTSDRPWNIE